MEKLLRGHVWVGEFLVNHFCKGLEKGRQGNHVSRIGCDTGCVTAGLCKPVQGAERKASGKEFVQQLVFSTENLCQGFI